MPVADGADLTLPNGKTVQMPGALNKPAGQRCLHQKHGVGCALHGTPKMPYSCAIWNCRWLVNDDTADMQRPDRTHYVIDIMPDIVEAVHNDTGGTLEMEVIQIWIDPDYPEAHCDPALRRYIDRQRKCALIRFNERDGIFVAPPSVTGEGWYEKESKASPGRQSTRINKLADRLGYTIAFEGETSDTGMTRTLLRAPDGRTIEIATKPRPPL
jgi:hypothetical protein